MAEKEMFNKPGPLIIDAQAADNWRKFLMRFEIYLIAAEKEKKSDKVKVSLLLNCAGSDAIEEYSHFVYSEGESPDDFKVICKKFEELCRGAKNVIYERLVFNQRCQKEGERIDSFVSDLKRLALTCEFETLKDSLIRDRIVGGVISDELRGELLKKPDLTLETAHDYCRTYEASENQKFKFSSSSGSIGQTLATNIQDIKKMKHKLNPVNSGRDPLCKFCGLKHPFSHPTKCPAFRQQCRKCKKEGHYARMCKTPAKQNDVNPITPTTEDDSDCLPHKYFNSIELESVRSVKTSKSMITLKVNGHHVKVKADTGADATVIPYELYRKISKKPLQKIQQPLKAWLAAKPIHPVGCTRLRTQYNSRSMDLLYLVVHGDFTPLLSCDACLDLEVLKFMNVDLIQHTGTESKSKTTHSGNMDNLIKTDPVLKDYQDCFSEYPGKLPNPVSLEIDESVTPVIHPPRKIPIALLKPTKEKLLEMEHDGIIVKEEGHTPWVSSMLIVDKRKRKGVKHENGQPTKEQVRICIDPRDLNTALKRVHHPMATVEEVASKLCNAVSFTTLDACSGFWQLPMDENSSKLLTFNTPWGRYRFTRLPFGIAPAPEIYQREMEKLFQGVPVDIIVDDFLIHARDENEMNEKLRMVLERSREVGLKFNPTKLKLRVNEVNYVGHVLTSQGLKPDPEKIKAIVNMPPPIDKEGVQRFLGTVNYLDKFIERKAELQGPITQLTQQNAAFVWETPQQEAFERLKVVISSSPVLSYFDNDKSTVLNVDSSSTGLGGVVMQDGKPIAYGSRTLTESEKRYANIEREMLAIAWGAEKFHTYLYGRKVVVETDHKPLEAIFKKPLNSAPPRLQRMLLKLTKYDLDVHYVPGKQQVISDCLSRAAIKINEPSITNDGEIEVNLIDRLGLENDTLSKFKVQTCSDETSKVVMEYVLQGWPSTKDGVDELAREYWSFREELSVEDGLLFKADRVVVPRAMRAEVLDEIHGAHMGESKSLSFARDYVFWPSMTSQIRDRVRSCGICNAFRHQQQKETLKSHEIPSLPWQVVGTDLFEYGGQTYLVVTDFYSKYFELELLRKNTAICLINNMKKIFARYGIPQEVVSDNGSQYSNTRNLFDSTHLFKEFAQDWGFHHTTSSPEYPQSNGAAERAVQTAKRILKKAEADGKDPFEGLLKYRNTPFEDIGVSPTQMLMSRRTRTTLPTHRRLLLPQPVEPEKVVKALKMRQEKAKLNYDLRGRDLPPLEEGEKVRIRPNGEKLWRKAEVLPRSYVVKDERGRVYRRNRRQIISVPQDQPMISQPKPPPINTSQDEPCKPSDGYALNSSNTRLTTRSGRAVKKPERLIEQC